MSSSTTVSTDQQTSSVSTPIWSDAGDRCDPDYITRRLHLPVTLPTSSGNEQWLEANLFPLAFKRVPEESSDLHPAALSALGFEIVRHTGDDTIVGDDVASRAILQAASLVYLKMGRINLPNVFSSWMDVEEEEDSDDEDELPWTTNPAADRERQRTRSREIRDMTSTQTSGLAKYLQRYGEEILSCVRSALQESAGSECLSGLDAALSQMSQGEYDIGGQATAGLLKVAEGLPFPRRGLVVAMLKPVEIEDDGNKEDADAAWDREMRETSQSYA